MPIKFSCPNCKKNLAVKEELAGKRVACPACKKPMSVPAASAVPKTNSKDQAKQVDVEALALAAFTEQQAAGPAEVPKFIDFNCPQCDESVRMPLEMQGKQAPCPSCRRIVKVPLLVKKDAADWRKAATHLPSAARTDTQPAPEGAWGSTAPIMVSREALQEAASPPKRPITRQQKIKRVILAVGTACILGLAVWLGMRFLGKREQDKAYAQAMSYLEKNKADLAPESQATLYFSAGVFRFRALADDEDISKVVLPHFRYSRDLLSGNGVGSSADLLLIELALAEVDLGGKKLDADQGRRLLWNTDLITTLRQTLEAIRSPEALVDGVRAVSRKLILAGQEKLADALAKQLAQSRAGIQAKTGAVHEEVPELLAVVGLELYQANPKDPSIPVLAQTALSYYKTGPDVQDKNPPIAPSLVALCDLMQLTPPQAGKALEDLDNVKIGHALANALAGNLESARQTIMMDIKADEARFKGLVALAIVAMEKDPGNTADLTQAVDFLEERLKDKAPPWQVSRLSRLAYGTFFGWDLFVGAASHSSDLGEKLNGFQQDRALQSWAQLEAALAQAAGKGPSDWESLADSVDKGTPSHWIAWQEIVRRNGGSMKDVESLPEPQRSFASMGVALGLQDKVMKK